MSYKFNQEFQEHILASILSDAKFLKDNSESIRPEYFGDELLGGIAQVAKSFYNEHKECISKPVLLKEVKQIIAPGRKYHEYQEAVEKIWSLKEVNKEYYQKQALQFARSQAISGALRSSIPLLEQGDFNEIAKLIKDAVGVGEGDSERVYDYFGGAASRIKSYLNGHSHSLRFSTGLTILDDCMSGGLGKGELGVIVALAGHGKTTTLVNFGSRALLQNKVVVYFTLELSKDMIAKKFDTSLFGRTLESIKSAPRDFAEALAEMRDKLTGKLYIIEYPTKGITVSGMESILSKIGNVDVVLVDYAQLVRASRSRDDEKSENTEVYEGLRKLAGELRFPLWTAHQANRPGTNAKVIGVEHIAEDFNVAAISDICISANYNEEELRKGQLRFYVMKSRIGPSGIQINCNVNWKMGRITQAG